MRLWVKIAAVCAVVLIAVVMLTSTLLLMNARNNVLALTVENAKEKQSNLARSFSAAAKQRLTAEMGEEAHKETLIDCFSTYADETCVLVRGYETQYSFVDMEPQDILFLTASEQRVFLDELGSRNLLIVGSLVTIPASVDAYAVYIVKDITSVYNAYNSLVFRCAIISAVGILMGILLIVALVRAQSRPLKALSIAAARIADGSYGERADIHTKDEVGALAVDFNRMAEAVQTHVDALEERNTRQNLFIAGLTHEFKTPMASMMLHSETLLNLQLNREQQEKSLGHIYEQCRWLERLTQKLLSLITLEEALRPVPCPLPALFDRVQAGTAETLAARGHQLTLSCPENATLSCDPDLMQSLLVNLVENASKASEPGKPILLKAEGHTLSVTDQGRGIPGDAMGRVTDPFFMVDKSRSKKQGGSGLGLALVKRIADAHSAILSIDSKEGQGTTVSVTLP